MRALVLNLVCWLYGGACFNQKLLSTVSWNTCLYDRFAGNWRAWLQMLPWAVLGKTTMIFVWFCTCLRMLLTTDKLYFHKIFGLFVAKKIIVIRRHSGLLPSNNWPLLGFKLCSSSNKFIASLLVASDHSVYALVNVNMTEVKQVKTYYFHPKWGKIIFLSILIQNLFVWSAMQHQLWKVR